MLVGEGGRGTSEKDLLESSAPGSGPTAERAAATATVAAAVAATAGIAAVTLTEGRIALASPN